MNIVVHALDSDNMPFHHELRRNTNSMPTRKTWATTHVRRLIVRVSIYKNSQALEVSSVGEHGPWKETSRSTRQSARTHNKQHLHPSHGGHCGRYPQIKTGQQSDLGFQTQGLGWRQRRGEKWDIMDTMTWQETQEVQDKQPGWFGFTAMLRIYRSVLLL